MTESESITLNLPGPATREWWLPSKAKAVAWERSEDDGKSKPSDTAGYGFSAFSCHSYPLWISSDDPEIIGRIAMTELELLNAPLAGRQAESQVILRTVASDGPRTLIQAVVIPAQLEEPTPHKAVRLQQFFPACFAFAFPRRSILLWREMNRWVVGFSRDGVPVHFQGFGRGALDDDVATEILCLLADLESRLQVDEISGVVVWSDGQDNDGLLASAEIVGKRLNLPVECVPRPEPDTLRVADIGSVPEAIVLEREESRRRSKGMAIANAVAFVYVLAVAAGVMSLFLKQRSNEQLAQRIAEQKPQAEAVRDARDRWAVMRQSVEVDSYPVELFHRVASLLPPQGVRLTLFEIRGDQIIVKGEASSLPTWIKFKADLENSPELKDYEWRQGTPDGQGDTEKFTAYGNYRFASIDTEFDES